MRSVLWRHSPQIVFKHARMTKVHKSWWWCDEPSRLFPVFNSHVSSNWQASLPTLKITVRQDRCYSHMLSCSHTYCTPWHTRAHSLPKTTGHVKGKPGQISLSSDISATFLAVCLTILPFWAKLGSRGKHFVMSPFKEGLDVGVDVKGCASRVLGRYFFTSNGGYFVISVLYGLL